MKYLWMGLVALALVSTGGCLSENPRTGSRNPVTNWFAERSRKESQAKFNNRHEEQKFSVLTWDDVE